ncbi:prepilin-type N-terminal cleavage/methylation domain-containing protein [Shimwellia pseudoproteus]|nr:prepilin-type N-terminal cleavage/methylation domain-containing protein [Shimwellia pseudoproteus]MBJ3813828.1 prepilin-type N-terminal cleavage/methylation domain-containing protein [Shimwellia pseudoproteus]
MPGAQRGHSLPEVLVAMVLLLLVVTALAGYQRGLLYGLDSWQQGYRLAYMLEGQLADPPAPLPDGWRRDHQQIPQGGCTRQQVTLLSPQGRQARLSALHCR